MSCDKHSAQIFDRKWLIQKFVVRIKNFIYDYVDILVLPDFAKFCSLLYINSCEVANKTTIKIRIK